MFVVYGCTVAVIGFVNYYLGERLKLILSRKSVGKK